MPHATVILLVLITDLMFIELFYGVEPFLGIERIDLSCSLILVE
jgi:hypothetical protein